MAPEKSASNSSFVRIQICPENFESPFGGLNGLRMPRKIPKNTFEITSKCSVSFCRLRKVLIRPNRTSYAKVTPKTVQHPRNPNRSSGRSLFLAAPLIKQLHTNCTDEPAYSITSDHHLKQLQIELQDQNYHDQPS